MTRPQSTQALAGSGDGVYSFHERLKFEAAHQNLVELLFLTHKVVDVSQDKREQKNGNDFFLYPDYDETQAPIRCENKFESKTTGNCALELISYDRPRIAAGWMFTSKCGYMLHWYPTGEVCVWPMQPLRSWTFNRVQDFSSSTARNPSYLSWNLLPKIEVAMREIPDARVLDLAYEIGYQSECKNRTSILSPKTKEAKRCTVAELIALMKTLPRESRPSKVAEAQLIHCMQLLEARNFKRGDAHHMAMIDALPSEYGLKGSSLFTPAQGSATNRSSFGAPRY